MGNWWGYKHTINEVINLLVVGAHLVSHDVLSLKKPSQQLILSSPQVFHINYLIVIMWICLV